MDAPEADAALHSSEELLMRIIDNLAEGLIVFGSDGQSLHWNRRALAMHGYAQHDEKMINLAKISADYVMQSPEGQVLPMEQWPIQRLMRGEPVDDVEINLNNTHQHWTRSFSYGGVLLRDEAGKPQFGLLTIRDITERKQAEKARAEAEQRLQLAVDIAHLGAWEWSVLDNSVYFSAQWKKLLGFDEAELPDKLEEWSSRLHPADRERVLNDIRAIVQHPLGTLKLEYRMRHRDELHRWMVAQAIASLDEQGHTVKLIGTMLDVTEQKQVEQRLLEVAQHDPLTGLPNRALIFDYASHLLAAAQRKHSRGAMLFIDLDRFKPVNDLYGHEVGDNLLKEVGARLTACVRHEDLIGRIGGDEFVIVLSDIGKDYSALTAAQHLIDSLSRPFQIGGFDLSISASVGISFFPRHGSDVDSLLHAADLAMYHAKEAGRSGYYVYTSELHNRLDTSASIEARLKDGLKNHRLQLHYQPVLNMQSGKLIGAEALLRLPADGQEPVGPDRFIPIAESAGMIAELGDWVASEVCRQHRQWRALGLPPLIIAMNVSSLQFRQRGFVARLLVIVSQSQIEPACFQIEVTESTVMEGIDEAIGMLTEIHAAGICIALDDFGTGYSSLSDLSHMPLDKLKLDPSFVQGLTDDRSSQAITEAIIAFGHTLNLEIVGEGIESEQSLNYLRLHGCQEVQGNLFSGALPAMEFVDWYRKKEHAQWHA